MVMCNLHAALVWIKPKTHSESNNIKQKSEKYHLTLILQAWGDAKTTQGFPTHNLYAVPNHIPYSCIYTNALYSIQTCNSSFFKKGFVHYLLHWFVLNIFNPLFSGEHCKAADDDN